MEFIKERGVNKHQKKVSLYRCKCGKEFEAVDTKVKSGHTTSCGCSRGEKHGDYRSSLAFYGRYETEEYALERLKKEAFESMIDWQEYDLVKIRETKRLRDV